jgi:16S rRNA (adenine1518-N6/adenine1519-N6)-dimethyltransferase
MNPRKILTQHNLRPDKRLSQNFMVDASALARMAAAAELAPDDVVLEVGAGLGHLTRELAEQAGRVVAVEVDTRLVPLLRMAMAGYRNVILVTGDILDLEPGRLVEGGPYTVVANVPYHITSALVRHLLENDDPPELLVLTVQREVAERMAATPGDMSLLAVSVQFYGAVKVVHRLKPGTFYPRPGVDSAIVRIEPHPEPLLPPDERDEFFRVARAGFSQKRKQLKNSLAAGLGLPGEGVVAQLEAADIDPTRRAETLSMDEWRALYEAFASDG